MFEEQTTTTEEAPPLRKINDRKPTVNIIAGRNPVIEALRAGTIIEKVVILAGVKGNIIERIKQMAKRNRVPVMEVGKQKFLDLVSDTTTQGVVAVVGTKAYVEIDDILSVAKERSEAPFVLILDEIEDPQNLGALLGGWPTAEFFSPRLLHPLPRHDRRRYKRARCDSPEKRALPRRIF